jgi:hypothetical protein
VLLYPLLGLLFIHRRDAMEHVELPEPVPK